MEKVIWKWAMVGGEKKDQDEDIKIVVAAALQAPVIAIVITSQCVEHQLFFDPFVMISIQPVRTPLIQNGFCRISRYGVTVSFTKPSPGSCVSNLLPHVEMCVTVRGPLIVSRKRHICVCDG